MPPSPRPFDRLAEARRQWTNHYSAAGAEGLAAVTSAARIAQLLRQGAEEALAPFGISYAHFELLSLVMWSRAGGLPMSVIAARLQLPPASLTHTVDKLEKEGLIARIPDSRDKRSLLVSITDQGIALAAAAGPALNEYFESLDLPGDSATALIELGSNLRRRSGEYVADSPY